MMHCSSFPRRCPFDVPLLLPRVAPPPLKPRNVGITDRDTPKAGGISSHATPGQRDGVVAPVRSIVRHENEEGSDVWQAGGDAGVRVR
jgi:hypothetical protein